MGETAMHRPYIRSEVRAEVENRAQRDEQGRFLDANTGKPIEGRYDLGHKAGHEHWRESERAEREGLTQEEFNNRMNNPDYYQIEDPHSNRSHEYEDKTPEEQPQDAETSEQGNHETAGESESESEENELCM